MGKVMFCTREELEARERTVLARWAQFSADSRGRHHPDPAPEWRTQYQRDRDRVIHSRAFRRLEYKTQVFLNGTGDHLRTRLTHTMEVAAIARNIARALRLNEDLAEAIALAHDLGHPPFGHTGEQVLDRLMRPWGGFEHNVQSLRIVDELERKYPRFAGLNLSWEVREGLAKHRTPCDDPAEQQEFRTPSSSLEAQIANLADEIAYYSHDLDDGLEAGLLVEDELVAHVETWRRTAEKVRREAGRLSAERRRYYTIRCLIDDQVRDVVATTAEALNRAGLANGEAVRARARSLVRYSPERRKLNLQLRRYLYANLYLNPEVREPNQRAALMLGDLFACYLKRPAEIGDSVLRRQAGQHPERAVCDYLAGMTDRFVMLEYERLIGPPPEVRHRGVSAV